MLDPKFSHLIRAGAIVHSSDGGIYRCTSKFASEGTVKYRLADLQGKPVQTPADFCPVSPALARFAAWAICKIAYNSDFDLYVKTCIEQAGYPIDPSMNWAKYLQRLSTRLSSRDPEVVDEAWHNVIIKYLIEQKALEKFPVAIKKFPPAVQLLPLESQVTEYLKKLFGAYGISKANDYIKRYIFQENADSMWGGDDEDEGARAVNLLDTEELAQDGGYDRVEADVEIERFRKGFAEWLVNQGREKTARQYLLLFDVIYEEVKNSDEIPKFSDIYEVWEQQVGTGKKSVPWFKAMFSNLSKLIGLYTSKIGDKYEVHPFLEIMKQVGRRRKVMEPAMASAKKADSGFYGMEVAPMDAGGEFVKNMLEPGSSDSGSKSFSMPGEVNDLAGTAGEAGEAAEGVAGAIGDLAPLVALASVKEAKQWENPKCKSCGSFNEVHECPACKNMFCSEHMLDHHANNPSHARIANFQSTFNKSIAAVLQGDA